MDLQSYSALLNSQFSSVGGSNAPYTDLPTATQTKEEEAFQSCLTTLLLFLLKPLGFIPFQEMLEEYT
ncbi:hypothetical protein SRHO_G00249480 [Serrasalmus rhombeus]